VLQNLQAVTCTTGQQAVHTRQVSRQYIQDRPGLIEQSGEVRLLCMKYKMLVA
jgi:hypothetical protein